MKYNALPSLIEREMPKCKTREETQSCSQKKKLEKENLKGVSETKT
jgi:hypothetical protein